MSFSHWLEYVPFSMQIYCGWKKSCTILDGWNPINNGINHRSTAAGFRNHPPYVLFVPWVTGGFSRHVTQPMCPPSSVSTKSSRLLRAMVGRGTGIINGSSLAPKIRVGQVILCKTSEVGECCGNSCVEKNKMKPTNPNAHTYVNGTDVKTHGYAVTHNTFLQ